MSGDFYEDDEPAGAVQAAFEQGTKATTSRPEVRIAVLVVTDGRDEYLLHTVRSAMAHLSGPITEWWMYDDTGDYVYRDSLARRYPTFRHFDAGHRQGFGGAIRACWARLAEHSTVDYVFHLEQDFTLRRRVDLGELAAVMDTRPYLAQMALVRQAWNDEERAAGGLIACHPDAYQPATDGAGRAWLEHRLFWTTNPSLYHLGVCRRSWPDGPQSEGRFTLDLLAQGLPGVAPRDVRFGYWGRHDDGPWVEHIGETRSGHGY